MEPATVDEFVEAEQGKEGEADVDEDGKEGFGALEQVAGGTGVGSEGVVTDGTGSGMDDAGGFGEEARGEVGLGHEEGGDGVSDDGEGRQGWIRLEMADTDLDGFQVVETPDAGADEG